jgi:hypothetical protein
MQMRKKPLKKKSENCFRIQLGNHQRLSATMLLKSLYPTLLAYIIFMLNLGDAAVELRTTHPKDFNSIPVCLFTPQSSHNFWSECIKECKTYTHLHSYWLRPFFNWLSF